MNTKSIEQNKGDLLRVKRMVETRNIRNISRRSIQQTSAVVSGYVIWNVTWRKSSIQMKKSVEGRECAQREALLRYGCGSGGAVGHAWGMRTAPGRFWRKVTQKTLTGEGSREGTVWMPGVHPLKRSKHGFETKLCGLELYLPQAKLLSLWA